MRENSSERFTGRKWIDMGMKKGSRQQEKAVNKWESPLETSAENICRHLSVTARKEDPCHRDTQRLNYLWHLVEGHTQCSVATASNYSKTRLSLRSQWETYVRAFSIDWSIRKLFDSSLSPQQACLISPLFFLRKEKIKHLLLWEDRKWLWSIYHVTVLLCFCTRG